MSREERLKDLAKVDPAAWPWAEWMYAVRDHELLVPADGQAPVWEGLRIGIPSKWNPERIEFAEFGKVRGTTITAREAGSATWNEQKVEQVAALGIEPGHLSPAWPEDDDARGEKALETVLKGEFRRWGNWPALRWSTAPDAWVEKWWPRVESLVVLPLASVCPYYTDDQRVPVVVDGGLRIAKGRAVMDGKVIPPTEAGWARFLALAPASGLKWGELAEAGEWWWGQKIPRDLLSSARDGAERDAA